MCLGPDSNRHGVAPEGFSYHYSFRCCVPHLWSGLYLCRPVLHAKVRSRIRQEPSSLYTFPMGAAWQMPVPAGLARYCRRRWPRYCSTDFDPIHAGRFRAGCSIT